MRGEPWGLLVSSGSMTFGASYSTQLTELEIFWAVKQDWALQAISAEGEDTSKAGWRQWKIKVTRPIYILP